jgi:hypothetical protein
MNNLSDTYWMELLCKNFDVRETEGYIVYGRRIILDRSSQQEEDRDHAQSLKPHVDQSDSFPSRSYFSPMYLLACV